MRGAVARRSQVGIGGSVRRQGQENRVEFLGMGDRVVPDPLRIDIAGSS